MSGTSSFHEVQFPPTISQGARGGMRFNTTVTSLSSASEQRNINWKYSRGTWDVKYGLRTQTDIELLIDFFAARRGRAYGFRFKDWIDYRNPRWDTTPGDLMRYTGDSTFALQWLFETNNVNSSFQLSKTYQDYAGSYVRLITKPVKGTMLLKNQGTGATLIEGTVAGVTPPYADYDVNYSTGIVDLAPWLWETPGIIIEGAFEFDVPVRFDIDDMQASVTTTEIYSWEAINVVEIREIV